jgi:hypothetical protein
MDINLNRISQGDDSEQCLPKKVEEHLLNRKGRYQGGWVGKKIISLKTSFNHFLVKGVAIETTSPANCITIMA